MTLLRSTALLTGLSLLSACEGRQSVLNPAGRDAQDVLGLIWVMFGGAALLWFLLGAIFAYVTRVEPREMPRRWGEALIIGGGVIFPVILLGALLAYSLPMMAPQRAAEEGLKVHITAEQWWWRVAYELPDGRRIVSANELRLPVGRRTGLVLNAHKVIHAFWVPALGGKVDMIPGRETYLSFQPEEPGVYRGQCAEFCGASHALMAFETVVMTPEDYAAWLEAEAADAQKPASAEAYRGAEVFAREGCGACHTVRGTSAAGQVGPDLTHVGSRKSLGAGILQMTQDDLSRFVAHTEAIKPEVAMPSYDHLTLKDLRALAAYLKGLT
ncbi:cytochrome c oxidase subunit II [Sulfitobacter maritimus]|uniref:cytochrome c oxidase subunit II n=1 Tax=Sulfitobacter maritimus TaxID=2741719 RepID=UPI0031B62A98